jgi:hypothetical protein
MGIDRPDWNFDNSGAPVAPEMPSVQTVSDMIVRGEKPTQEIQRAFAEHESGLPADPLPTVPRDAKGNIVRQDWSQPRNESGQFITKSESELRQQWQREGGFEQNRDRVLATEAAILNLSANPLALQSHIATLPEAIQLKAADVMRLAPSYREGGAIKFGMFIDSLSPSEYQVFETWWRKLSRGDQDAILATISR